jgi:6-pyruvoyltetrahydropterin/6-carboxytetrahydropterin synthase
VTRVTRRYRFAASHRLNSPRFSGEQNRDLYGKCNNPHGHGHDYVLEIGVVGPKDASSGLVVSIPVLDRLVDETILRDFDHRYFNADVGEFSADLVPTSENILSVIERRLRDGWSRVFPAGAPRLESIRLQETKRNRFELTVDRES